MRDGDGEDIPDEGSGRGRGGDGPGSGKDGRRSDLLIGSESLFLEARFLWGEAQFLRYSRGNARYR